MPYLAIYKCTLYTVYDMPYQRYLPVDVNSSVKTAYLDSPSPLLPLIFQHRPVVLSYEDGYKQRRVFFHIRT